MQPRMCFRRYWMLIILAVFTLPGSRALAQTPTPTVLWQFRTPGLPQTERFNLVQNRLHFAPGAATPFHDHPGQVVVTVLEGENTFTLGGVEQVYHAGESFVEQPNQNNQARNAGSAPMNVMATYLLPWNAPLSHPTPGDATALPRPTTSYQFRTDIAPMPEPFDVVQQGLEFAPGAATPWHTHPGLVMVTVLSGELTFSYHGTTTIYREGESFVEERGVLAQARNASDAPTRVMASYLLPTGAPLSNPQSGPGTGTQPATPAQLPNTSEDSAVATTWLGLLAGVGLITAGWWIRRRQVRS